MHLELKEEGEVNAQKGRERVRAFVKVPPSATTPTRYEPMENDAINQVTSGREQRKRVTFNCNGSSF